jgi:hypothetical protein
MALSDNAFIGVDYFNLMSGDELVIESSSGQSNDELRLINLINSITKFFECFCNRTLKTRDFSYISTDLSYNPQYSIFDPPPKETFWFPTYPVNTLTTFIIGEDVILPSINYEDNDGYFLYNHIGKLIYSYGFDYGCLQNIKVKWNGGYKTTHEEYAELQYLTYLFTKSLFDNDPNQDGIISETLGNYKYTKTNPKDLSQYLGVPSFIFHTLNNYKRYSI